MINRPTLRNRLRAVTLLVSPLVVMKPRVARLLCLFLFLLCLSGQWWFTRECPVPVDEEPDGVIYLALAHNLLAHGIYSAGQGPELVPTYHRLPGYPLVIAGVYALCGDGNEGAVRSFQALLTTLACACVAGLAFLWEPVPDRRTRAALIAFLLAALCPFTMIYTGIILSETLTCFLVMLLMLVATCAFLARTARAQFGWWLASGLLAGAAQLVRPESGLFAASIGFTLVGFGWAGSSSVAGVPMQTRWRGRFRRVFRDGAIFSVAFVAMLVPWTIRNARVFHVFAPLPPANVALPGEKTYSGFCAWYRTWADSERYLKPFYWGMTDNEPASVDDLPPSAFDTAAERERTVTLFERYNAPTVPGSPDSPRAGLTRELDDEFAQLARQRSARSPWRFYVGLPLRRAVGLWFVPHAQYYSFEGSLFPLSKMPLEWESHLWLPIFFALMCGYTALGLLGMWRLVRVPEFARSDARRWLGLVLLVIVPRWVYLSTLENTEPRYMVEVFPFLCVLGGLALAGGVVKDRKTVLPVEEIPPDIPSRSPVV